MTLDAYFYVMMTFNDVRLWYVVFVRVNIINACDCLCYSQICAVILALIQ